MHSPKRYIEWLYVGGIAFVFIFIFVLFSSERVDPSIFETLRHGGVDESSLVTETSSSTSEIPTHFRTPFQPPPNTTSRTNWTSLSPEEAENYGLESNRCVAAFPGLFKEVERALSYWQDRKIQLKDIDVSWKPSGIVRALIHDRRVR